jgi:ferritin-like metal-binding protein YciE
MKLESMQDLLVAEMQDLLSVERQMAVVLPKVIREVAHVPLRKELEAHLAETTQQEQRLESCFHKMGLVPQAGRSHGMIGLISGWMEVQSCQAQKDVLDAAIISSVQHMEHYEIAGYGCARAFAQVLELMEVAELLGRTLAEEERFDRRLSELAKLLINREAQLHSA